MKKCHFGKSIFGTFPKNSRFGIFSLSYSKNSVIRHLQRVLSFTMSMSRKKNRNDDKNFSAMGICIKCTFLGFMEGCFLVQDMPS